MNQLFDETLSDLAAIIRASDAIVICGHINPDGDCIGSQLALQEGLRQLGKTVTGVLADTDPIEGRLCFLEGDDLLIPARDFPGPIGLFIAVDAPDRERIGDGAALLDRAATSIVIDHHEAEVPFTAHGFTDSHCAATANLIWLLLAELGCDRTATIATDCLTGLFTDTGRFCHQNADALTFRLASEMVEAGASPAFIARELFSNRSLASVLLEARVIDHLTFTAGGTVAVSFVTREDLRETGALKSDLDTLVDLPGSIGGVEVSALLSEYEDYVRVSLRSEYEADVAAIAERFGGGGHVKAAGFRTTDPLKTVRQAVLEALTEIAAG